MKRVQWGSVAFWAAYFCVMLALSAEAQGSFWVLVNGALRSNRPIVVTGSITGSSFVLGAFGSITAAADGIFSMLNNAGTGFTRLNLGGTTSSFPSLVVNGANLDVKVADNSGFSQLRAFSFVPTSRYDIANGLMYVTAPTVTSAGTSPTVPNSNGSASFRVNVGTGGTATTIVMAMPATTAGWNCEVENLTANAANRIGQRVVPQSSTTNSVTVQNQTIATGAALAFTASDIVQFVCFAF